MAAKQGTGLTVFDDSEGANPHVVTETQPLPVALRDDNGNTVVEPFSGAVHTIEQEHAEIHAGNGYQLSGEIVDLAGGASLYISLDPNGNYVHFRNYRFTANSAPADIELFKNPTVNTLGALLVPHNRNQASSNTSGALIHSGTTMTADGERLDLGRIEGTGSGNNVTGEMEGIPVEWILDGGNTYALKVTNNDNNPMTLTYRIFWYE